MVSFRGPLLSALVRAGHEVYAFAIDYDPATEARVRALGAIPVRYAMDRTGTNPLKDLVTAFRLSRSLRSYRIDLVLSYFIKPVIYGTLAATVAGVPRRYALLPGLGYAFTDVGGTPFKRRALAGLLRVMLRTALAKVDRVFLYNPDDLAEIVRLRLVSPDKIIRLNGTGIDLNDFAVAPPVTDPVVFVLAARLLAEKGIREFAAAAREVKRRTQRARFVLLGGLDSNPGGLPESEVRAWVDDGTLEWPGHVADVRPWLKEASVYVLPSYREGVPRSTQEAMAMGRPVITTDAPGCRETVVDGQNGFLVPVRASEILADRMMHFIEEPHLIEAMGRASRELAEERFDVRAINERLLQSMGLA